MSARIIKFPTRADGYAMSFSFDDLPDDFVSGYEAGLLQGRLAARPPTWGGTYHTANLEAVRRVAVASGYDAHEELSIDSTWTYVTFTPRAAAPAPHPGDVRPCGVCGALGFVKGDHA